jgi:formylglycine-generating enzyme required for sulfatase activity
LNDSVAPQGALAQELEQVSHSARALRDALARSQRDLPEDFPKGDLDALAATLELTPQMSADGAIHALTYARPKLSQIRRRSVRIGDDDDDLPDVPRGGAIDQAITRLIADVDTAREWYDDWVQAAAEQSSFPETATIGGSPELKALSERADKLAHDTAAIADELAEGASAGSVPADNLQRRVRDVAVLSRQEGIELAALRPRPRLIDQLHRAIAASVPWVETGLRAVEVTADFAKIGIDRFSNVLTRQITVICEEIGGFARDGQALLARYQKEFVASVELQPPPHQPSGEGRRPDFAVFRDVDAPWCPEMVALPVGEFLMGSPESEEGQLREGKLRNEGPQHQVTIATRFAIGRYPVTFEEYDHFCDATKREAPEDEGWGRGRRPVINVSWRDWPDYLVWLAGATGKPYRLPSEAEWEYACRAGTTTRYAFGEQITVKDANFGMSVRKTTEVGSYPANAWGFHDMHGNVWELVEDAWHDSYQGAPADGTAWTHRRGFYSGPSRVRVVRGGSWDANPRYLRSTVRIRNGSIRGINGLGFRVARTLD